jgi:ribosomal protein S12 methylthiotransferase accessory factor
MLRNECDAGLDRLLELVSSRVGVIRSLTRVYRGPEEPEPPVLYQAILSHFDYRKASPGERHAAGKGRTESEAARGAIGEAVERYCASHFSPGLVRKAKWRDLEGAAVLPPDFVLYSESQYARRNFPYHHWRPEDEVTWMPVRELPGEGVVFVPASLIYLTFPSLSPEDYFATGTSNGLAAGSALPAAILNGLYELVERDAFLITWLNRLPAPEVNFSQGDDDLARSISTHYYRFGTEIRVFNLSTNLPIYVMMGVALDKTERGPHALVGLGCHLNPQVALRKALFEVCQVHSGGGPRYQEEPPTERLSSYEDVHTPQDHSAFLSRPERIDEFSFLLRSGRQQSIQALFNHSSGNVELDLEECVRILVHEGCRVFYANLTTPDVSPYGLQVVRLITTGLQPLHFGFGNERLGGRRLYDIPRALGYATAVRTEGELNPCPHPLA